MQVDNGGRYGWGNTLYRSGIYPDVSHGGSNTLYRSGIYPDVSLRCLLHLRPPISIISIILKYHDNN